MSRIEKFLEKRDKDKLLRTLKPAEFRKAGFIQFKDKQYIDFSSNDYLGFSDHPKLKEACIKAAEKFGVGASASRLLSGNLAIHHRLEEETALFKEKTSSLFFNSGYQANVGIISSLCQRGDVIFSDKFNHASIIDGMVLSKAKFFRFPHNDPAKLKQLLKEQRARFDQALIIAESVFSMDGDTAPLAEYVDLAKEYNCKIMVDEAHATGVFGDQGSGFVQACGLSKKIDLIMGTYSKALGSFGAYVACSQKVKSYLINSSRSFIYSTALPPSVVAANLVSLELVKEESQRRKILLANAEYFRNRLKELGYQVRGSSQIVPLVIKDTVLTVQASYNLQLKGWWVSAIRPPTVADGQARLRFSLTYYHTKAMLDDLIKDICKIIPA